VAVAASLAIASLAIAAVAGCGNPPPAPAIQPTAPMPEPTPVAPAGVAVTPPRASATATQPATGGVIEDPALLSVLPETVDGVEVKLEPQAFADALTDPAFASSIEAGAFFVAVDGADIASGLVARPVPGRFSDEFFRDWRDTYNDGTCAQAGGVTANAEAELGGQTVYIATCAGGMRTYHAYIEEQGLVVSLFSLGDRGLGEELMADLQP
jgi:hypothetical protein